MLSYIYMCIHVHNRPRGRGSRVLPCASIHIHICIYMYIKTTECGFFCTLPYAPINTCMSIHVPDQPTGRGSRILAYASTLYTYIYIYIYICIYTYVYVYIYIYTYVYIHLYILENKTGRGFRRILYASFLQNALEHVPEQRVVHVTEGPYLHSTFMLREPMWVGLSMRLTLIALLQPLVPNYYTNLMRIFLSYGVATISRPLQIIGLFCKRALQKRLCSAKEIYNFKEPTNCSHPIIQCARFLCAYLLCEFHAHLTLPIYFTHSSALASGSKLLLLSLHLFVCLCVCVCDSHDIHVTRYALLN